MQNENFGWEEGWASLVVAQLTVGTGSDNGESTVYVWDIDILKLFISLNFPVLENIIHGFTLVLPSVFLSLLYSVLVFAICLSWSRIRWNRMVITKQILLNIFNKLSYIIVTSLPQWSHASVCRFSSPIWFMMVILEWGSWMGLLKNMGFPFNFVILWRLHDWFVYLIVL